MKSININNDHEFTYPKNPHIKASKSTFPVIFGFLFLWFPSNCHGENIGPIICVCVCVYWLLAINFECINFFIRLECINRILDLFPKYSFNFLTIYYFKEDEEYNTFIYEIYGRHVQMRYYSYILSLRIEASFYIKFYF